MYEDIEDNDGMRRYSCEDYGVRRHRSDAQPDPMSSSEDNDNKSYPELDESALLVAQVKLTRVFKI